MGNKITFVKMAPADIHAIISIKKSAQNVRKVHSARTQDPYEPYFSCIL